MNDPRLDTCGRLRADLENVALDAGRALDQQQDLGDLLETVAGAVGCVGRATAAVMRALAAGHVVLEPIYPAELRAGLDQLDEAVREWRTEQEPTAVEVADVALPEVREAMESALAAAAPQVRLADDQLAALEERLETAARAAVTEAVGPAPVYVNVQWLSRALDLDPGRISSWLRSGHMPGLVDTERLGIRRLLAHRETVEAWASDQLAGRNTRGEEP